MLIPLGTDRPLRHTTVVTYALLAANAVIFAAQTYLAQQSPDGTDRIAQMGHIWRLDFHWYQPLTSSFIHGGFAHLFFNLLFLWVFGPNIEDRLGRTGFIAFYLLGGACAMGLHAALSVHPAIGASGAISALTGAYLVMLPRTHIKVFSFFSFSILWVPAWWFIGLAIVYDFLAGGFGAATRIAHAAHIGGYLFGAGVSFALLGFKVLPGEPYDLFFQAKQAMRRRQIREAERSFARTVESNLAPGKRRPAAAAAESEALALARAGVVRLMGTGDLAGAAAEYKTLADTFGHLPRAATLSRRQQYDLAAHYYAQADYSAAAYAFERFLEAYPRDPESPEVRLLLGRIHARHLNDPVRAKVLLEEAVAGLRDQPTKQMARQELELLG